MTGKQAAVAYAAVAAGVGAVYGMDAALTAACIALPILGGLWGMRGGK